MTEEPSIARNRKANPPAGDTLAHTVAEMSDAELRELAGVVLAELKERTHDPASRGLSYQHIVSDLQRRLSDAHAYALSGFGRRDKSRLISATPLPSAPAAAPLSEEKKARLLLDFEAELLPAVAPAEEPDGAADPAADALPPDWDGQPDGAETAGAPEPSLSLPSFEEEIWQALQTGVGRSAAQKKPADEDSPPD